MPTPQDEAQRELYSERRQQRSLLPAAPDPVVQRKRMLIALGILLVALVAVVLKDWDFWFPSAEETQESAAPRKKTNSAIAAVSASTSATKSERKPAKASQPDSGAPFRATTERAVLPALQVEVVAGNRRTAVASRSSAIHLDMDSGTASAATQGPPAAQPAPASAADHVQLSPQTAQNVTVSVPPDYPLLARQMKVQGAVILQALISREGSIQELQIVSGPGILAAAAREAVKQWRFKPYYQSGQAVETQARITVNFTISTN